MDEEGFYCTGTVRDQVVYPKTDLWGDIVRITGDKGYREGVEVIDRFDCILFLATIGNVALLWDFVVTMQKKEHLQALARILCSVQQCRNAEFLYISLTCSPGRIESFLVSSPCISQVFVYGESVKSFLVRLCVKAKTIIGLLTSNR